MPIRKLTPEELTKAEALVDRIEAEIQAMAGSNRSSLVSLRRVVRSRLTQWDPAKPMVLRKLHNLKYSEQGGRCAVCGGAATREGTRVILLNLAGSFTSANARLVHDYCERDSVQASP